MEEEQEEENGPTVVNLAATMRTMQTQADERFNQLMEAIAALASSPANTQPTETPRTSVPPRPSQDPSEVGGRYKFSKSIPNPTPLEDGTNPTFEVWAVAMHTKFTVNADHFESEFAKMGYLFDRTQGKAQKHLLPRFKPDATHPYHDTKEMMDHLTRIYTNPNRVREAEVEYQNLRMTYKQTFHEFETQFLHLADEAEIPTSSRFYGLFDRLPTNLQDRLAPLLRSFNGSYDELCNTAIGLDAELKRINARRTKESQERVAAKTQAPPTTTTTRGSSFQKAPAPFAPTNLRSSTPTISHYGPILPDKKPDGRAVTPAKTEGVTCYNCGELGHYSASCEKPKRAAELKEIEDGVEEELEELESGNDSA